MLDMPTNGSLRYIQETTPNKDFASPKISMQTSEPCYICSDCGITYVYFNRAIDHITSGIHKGNSASLITRAVSVKTSRNYICTVCDATFSSNSNLNKHLLKHKGVLYKCNCCDKSSRNPGTLYKHIKDNHKDQNATVIKTACNEAESLDLLLLKKNQSINENNQTTQPKPEVATKRKHENDYENTELDSKKSKFTVTAEEMDVANILCKMPQTKIFP